jgi:hypothetical protein
MIALGLAGWLIYVLVTGAFVAPWRGGPTSRVSRREDPFGYWIVMGLLAFIAASTAYEAMNSNRRTRQVLLRVVNRR